MNNFVYCSESVLFFSFCLILLNLYFFNFLYALFPIVSANVFAFCDYI